MTPLCSSKAREGPENRGADPTLKKIGSDLPEKSDPTFEKNRIRPSRKTGSDLREKPDPTFEINRIRPSRKTGSDIREKPDSDPDPTLSKKTDPVLSKILPNNIDLILAYVDIKSQYNWYFNKPEQTIFWKLDPEPVQISFQIPGLDPTKTPGSGSETLVRRHVISARKVK